MWFGVISIFPEMFTVIKDYGINKRAINRNLVQLSCYNPRDYTLDRRATIDDKPYGGGPGMVMKVEPVLKAIIAAQKDCELLNFNNVKIVFLSPQGKKIKQNNLRTMVIEQEAIIFVCGRYEGLDERLYELVVNEQWSIGDFILSGGETAAMSFIDAMIRLIPGALGDINSSLEDSFSADNMLDYPHYTRPKMIYGLEVPKVLLSGHHSAITAWKQEQKLLRTKTKREDLL